MTPIDDAFEAPTAPKQAAESIAAACRAYWRFNVRLIAVLLGVGALVSFGVPLVAGSLEHITFAGWSLPFYMGAQGATIAYLALVATYIGAMTYADRRLRNAVDTAIKKANAPIR